MSTPSKIGMPENRIVPVVPSGYHTAIVASAITMKE